MAEFSIILAGNGGNLCNMQCHYCSACGVTEKDLKNHKKLDIKIDYNKMKETMDKNPIIQEHLKSGRQITINEWGGDPLMYYKYMEEIAVWIRKTYPTLKFSIFMSTNGLLLGAKHIQEWIYHMHKEYGLELQISHDGIGQYVRSKSFDPFYDPKTKDFIIQMAKDGIFNMINATLNQYNCSPIANFEYFQKWRYENHLENLNFYLKLNHLNDSEYCGDFKLKGENLNRYIHEMEQLWMDCYWAPKDNIYWKPFRSYFENQMRRWDLFKGLGGCGQFSSGQKDWTWCMNTLGEYVWCQLCNDPTNPTNPKCIQAEECKHCEFRYMDECHPCPAMEMAKECNYKKAYIRMVLRMKKFIQMVDSLRAENNKLRQNNGQVCSCQKPRS